MYHSNDKITIIARISSIILLILSISILFKHLFKLYDASHRAKSPSPSVRINANENQNGSSKTSRSRRNSFDTVHTTSAGPTPMTTEREYSGNINIFSMCLTFT